MKISLKGKTLIVKTRIPSIFLILAVRLLKRYCEEGKCSICEFHTPNGVIHNCGLYKYPYRWEIPK